MASAGTRSSWMTHRETRSSCFKRIPESPRIPRPRNRGLDHAVRFPARDVHPSHGGPPPPRAAALRQQSGRSVCSLPFFGPQSVTASRGIHVGPLVETKGALP
jgi:hypothetical protein